jgi:tetratricopeptide (TPR) repeat protein
MDLNPWNQWKGDGTPNPGTSEIVEILERVMKAQPNHPGANHFYIHAVEASPEPGRAVAAADRLGALEPGAGHLVHMPAHIYARVARYDDAVTVNQKAVAVDEKYIAEQKPEGLYPLMYTNHNIHFIWFGACMEGRYGLALEAARKVAGRIPPEVLLQFPMAEFLPPLPALTMLRFGRWDDVLEEMLPPPALRYASGVSHFARGVAWAQKGDVASARAELDSLRAIAALLPADQMVSINYALPLLRIGIAALDGEIAARGQRWDDAIASMKLAVAVDDSLHYDEPPTWYMPERQRLGETLLKAGRAAEAEQVFREELRRNPENGWSLRGLASALRAQNKAGDAKTADERFQKAWVRADPAVRTAMR